MFTPWNYYQTAESNGRVPHSSFGEHMFHNAQVISEDPFFPSQLDQRQQLLSPLVSVPPRTQGIGRFGENLFLHDTLEYLPFPDQLDQGQQLSSLLVSGPSQAQGTEYFYESTPNEACAPQIIAQLPPEESLIQGAVEREAIPSSPSNGKTIGKHTRRSLQLREKLEVIKFWKENQHLSVKVIGAHFDLPRTTVYGIIKNGEVLLEYVNTQPHIAEAFRIKSRRIHK